MSATALKPQTFERDDNLYLVAPVTPFEPDSGEIEEFAFAQELKKSATNPNLLWLKGQYVEADNPNANGHVWTSDELSIKSLTPMYCPVTVMHDPRTAVGLIADTRLLTPEKDNVPRARIETVMAIWAHRFPEVVTEIAANYEAGTLMQSMECKAPHYSCAECGRVFQKLPDHAEQAQWCEHLNASANASRILGGVTFTGTGLIFGTRGAEGAYSEAHLEVFQEEVAQSLSETHKSSTRTTRSRKVDIEQSKYEELTARPTKEELAAEKTRADEAESKAADAVKASEEAEVAQKKAEDELAEATKKVEAAEEAERAQTLSTERLGKLGKGFTKALPETVAERLKEQAKSLSDDDFEARITELEALTEVKRDEGSDDGDENAGAEDEFSTEEIASSAAGGGSGNGGGGSEPSQAARGSVVGSLIKSKAK